MKRKTIKMIQAVMLIVLSVFLLTGCEEYLDYTRYMESDFDGSKYGDDASFNAIYKTLDRTISNTIDVNGYTGIIVEIDNEKGTVDYTISDSVGNIIATRTGVTKERQEIPVNYSGFLKVEVTGNKARGKFSIRRQ